MCSVAEAAERLNTSVPRVHRSLRRLGVTPHNHGRGQVVDEQQLERLTDDLGAG